MSLLPPTGRGRIDPTLPGGTAPVKEDGPAHFAFGGTTVKDCVAQLNRMVEQKKGDTHPWLTMQNTLDPTGGSRSRMYELPMTNESLLTMLSTIEEKMGSKAAAFTIFRPDDAGNVAIQAGGKSFTFDVDSGSPVKVYRGRGDLVI